MILKALEECELVKIGIGSAQYDHTPDNPFTLQERKAMIQASLEEVHIPPDRFEIYGIPDLHDMEKWTISIGQIVGEFDVFYSNNEWTRQLFVKHGKAVAPLYKFNFERYNGTVIRQKLRYNESIQELVPPAVENYLSKINGKNRLL